MNTRYAKVCSSCLLAVWLACGGATQRAESSQNPTEVCVGAQPVELTDQQRAGSVFLRLQQPMVAPLRFACPTGAPCTLPPDSTIRFSARFRDRFACQFTTCRAPYAFAGLPFEVASNQEPCPPLLWSLAALHLQTNEGTVDLMGEQGAGQVNVLARREGDGYLRFIVESPTSMRRWLGSEQPRAVLLDVQLELNKERVRGQMSALAAPLPAEPSSELRFTALWTATWEYTVRR